MVTSYLPCVAEPKQRLTIDELAQRSGMTVRNIRAHQSRGLLPPPDLEGRTGYYDSEHLARLELIQDLQTEGFNLEAIRRLLERAPTGTASALVDFTRAVTEPFSDEQPIVITAQEFLERWGDQINPQIVDRLIRMGVLRTLGEGQFELSSERLDRAARELNALGVPLETLVSLVEEVRKHCQAIAREYTKLFLEQVWRPFQDAGEPKEQWDDVQAALDNLRPLATDAVVAIFQLTMTRATERALERELERMTGERNRGRRR
jgi:DNA-binding transcriptional MerR regulator